MHIDSSAAWNAVSIDHVMVQLRNMATQHIHDYANQHQNHCSDITDAGSLL